MPLGPGRVCASPRARRGRPASGIARPRARSRARAAAARVASGAPTLRARAASSRPRRASASGGRGADDELVCNAASTCGRGVRLRRSHPAGRRRSGSDLLAGDRYGAEHQDGRHLVPVIALSATARPAAVRSPHRLDRSSHLVGERSRPWAAPPIVQVVHRRSPAGQRVSTGNQQFARVLQARGVEPVPDTQVALVLEHCGIRSVFAVDHSDSPMTEIDEVAHGARRAAAIVHQHDRGPDQPAPNSDRHRQQQDGRLRALSARAPLDDTVDERRENAIGRRGAGRAERQSVQSGPRR